MAASWRDAVRVALAIMFLFTGATHFSGMQHDYLAMLPDPLPDGLWLIYLLGLLEIAGAIGLLIPQLGFVHPERGSSGERQGIGEAVKEGAWDFDDLVGRW